MAIEITITKAPRSVNTSKSSQIFTELGGTIGRGADNAWVLDDPNRYMSSRHAEIRCENGQYYLIDISTNGTFYNGANEPIGNGNRVALKDGDRFTLSDYEFQVSLRDGSAANAAFGDPFGASPFDNVEAMPFGQDFGSPAASLDDPFAVPFGNHAPVADAPFGPLHEETDPLAALDKANQFGSAGPRASFDFGNTQADHADPMNQAVAWPSAIPEDWDSDAPTPSRPAPVANTSRKPAKHKVPDSGNADLLDRLVNAESAKKILEEENRRLLADIVNLKQQLKNQQVQKPQPSASRSLSSLDRSLVEAMGLDMSNLSEQKMLEITQVAGELIRETIAGLMQVLGFRKRIKEEFRINVTTIQPVENNPLKFSANLEDALVNMFMKDNKAYQKPIEAVRESFQGIAEHQVAVLAGVQAAFRGMIERLDPEALEKRFEKYRGAGVIKVGQKGKNWDAYREFHQDLVNNMDNSFQHLFGYDFVQAYENQMQKLSMSRKAGSRDKNSEF